MYRQHLSNQAYPHIKHTEVTQYHMHEYTYTQLAWKHDKIETNTKDYRIELKK